MNPASKPRAPRDHPPAAPAERPRLSDAVYERLLAEILAGEHVAGDRLPAETQLALRLQVSRPVLREALQRLQNDGIVVARHGSGNYVQRRPDARVAQLTTQHSLRELLEAMEIRLVLEALSAQQAARQRSDAQLAAIEAAAQRLRRSIARGAAASDADYAFHRAIAEAAGNALLLQTLDGIATRVRGLMQVTLSITGTASRERRERVLDEHAHIVHAIRVGDGDSAAIAMRYHLDQARNRLLDRELDR